MTTGIGWIANVYQNAHLRYAYLYLYNLFIQVALLAMFVHLRLIIIPQTYVVLELLRKFSLILWPFELDSFIFIVNLIGFCDCACFLLVLHEYCEKDEYTWNYALSFWNKHLEYWLCFPLYAAFLPCSYINEATARQRIEVS